MDNIGSCFAYQDKPTKMDDINLLPATEEGKTPFVFKRKGKCVLYLRDLSPIEFICQEIQSENSMSYFRGVATPDPWNTSSMARSGKRTRVNVDSILGQCPQSCTIHKYFTFLGEDESNNSNGSQCQ